MNSLHVQLLSMHVTTSIESMQGMQAQNTSCEPGLTKDAGRRQITGVYTVVVVIAVGIRKPVCSGRLPVITPYQHVTTMQRITMKRHHAARAVTGRFDVVVFPSSVDRNWCAPQPRRRPVIDASTRHIIGVLLAGPAYKHLLSCLRLVIW